MRTHIYGGLVEGGYIACKACEELLDAIAWFDPCPGLPARRMAAGIASSQPSSITDGDRSEPSGLDAGRRGEPITG